MRDVRRYDEEGSGRVITTPAAERSLAGDGPR